MKQLVVFLLIIVALDVQAGNVFTTPYKSVDDTKTKTQIIALSKEIVDINDKYRLIDNTIREIKQKILARPIELSEIKKIASQISIFRSTKITTATTSDEVLKELTKQLFSLHKDKVKKEAMRGARSINCPKNKFCKIVFSPEQEGFGDIALSPFGNGTGYKINALNYSMFLGDEIKIPFQLYLAEKPAQSDSEDKNNKTLLDSTSGVALQFPIAYRYGGTQKGVCHFEVKNGHCIVGGDFTLRYIELDEQTELPGESKKKGVFGVSAGFGASLIFPILENKAKQQAGHFSIAANARHYYHNHDDSTLFFGEVTGPAGNAIAFKKSFAAATVTSEFAINEQFTIKAEYFSPLSNKDYLSDEFNISIVLAGL